MGLFNYEAARRAYRHDPAMLKILDCYENLDAYHLLRDAPSGIPDGVPRAAAAYRKWLGVCGGGYLFSTTLLSCTGHDAELNLDFTTLDEVNTPERLREYGLPEGWYVVALLNYGAPVCVPERGGKVGLWNLEDREFETLWSTFADFLADEYNTAADMLEDGILNPIPLKWENQ